MKKFFPHITVFIIIFSSIVFFVYKTNRTNVGSYQYIRKASQYIAEDKYRKALSLFHKAYEVSQKSEKIRKELIDGYVQYVRYLDKMDQISLATDYALKAYGIDGNDLSAKHVLAYLYAKTAIKESQFGKSALALEFLEKVVSISKSSKKVSGSISNFMFNKGIEAFNEKDGETVKLCLHTSYKLRPRFETLDFMGEYYHREPDLDKALFYWEKAQKARSDDDEMNNKIRKLKKEILACKDSKVLDTENFNVQMDGSYDIDIRKLQDMLRRIYDKVGEDLNLYPALETPIMLYREEDFRDIFDKKGITRAFYNGSIRMALSMDIDDPVFEAILAHEYTHAVVSIITANQCSIWLNEGIAVFEQARYMPISTDNVKEMLEADEPLSLELLEQGFDMREEDLSRVVLSYEGAYTVVLFILDEWGWGGVRGLLQRAADGCHYSNAIDSEFYISQSCFEEMWIEYLKEKFKAETVD